MIETLIALMLAGAGPAGFAIAGEPFAQSEILDARAVPALTGGAEIMISFERAAAKRLEGVTRSHLAKPIPVTLDGATVAEPIVQEPITGGMLMIGGDYSLTEAEALAKRISGKDPLPEEFEE